ncbi:hypothetical protein TNCV_3375091 [Trichonephila clavipes]|nr:hypothetical protein TNCV_3375091 [Trichonephila clavipes]
MSVEFHDVKNRQRSYRMIIRHVNDPYRFWLAWVLSTKLNSSADSYRQSSGVCLCRENWVSKLLAVNRIHLYDDATLKRDTSYLGIY